MTVAQPHQGLVPFKRPDVPKPQVTPPDSRKRIVIHGLWLYNPDVDYGKPGLQNVSWKRIEEWIERIERSEALCKGSLRCVRDNKTAYCPLGIACQMYQENLVSGEDKWHRVKRPNRPEYWLYSGNYLGWLGLSQVMVYFHYTMLTPRVESKHELVSFRSFVMQLNDSFMLEPQQIGAVLREALHPSRGAVIGLKDLCLLKSNEQR